MVKDATSNSSSCFSNPSHSSRSSASGMFVAGVSREGSLDEADNPFGDPIPKEPAMHYLREPYNLGSFWKWGNLGYQMQYSVELLEQELFDAGHPHVLQINALYGEDGSWQNPSRFFLYADGHKVAWGVREMMRSCFAEGPEVFKDRCALAVERANLPELTEREYYLLCRARDIAAHESFDEETGVIGGRLGRV